eukprot:463009-Pleurochrysis_carterae.AAC.1
MREGEGEGEGCCGDGYRTSEMRGSRTVACARAYAGRSVRTHALEPVRTTCADVRSLCTWLARGSAYDCVRALSCVEAHGVLTRPCECACAVPRARGGAVPASRSRRRRGRRWRWQARPWSLPAAATSAF